MSKANATARRERIERNIYRRRDGSGHIVHEVGYRDSAGRQRWRTVEGGITAARAERDDVLGRKGRGERVQPNPRLRFSEAADAWLARQVAELRPTTQAIYTNAVETHLRQRWGHRRLDAITVEDVANLVRELRREGKAEWTIAGVVKTANRTFKFARRRMNWHGQNPVVELEKGERPKVSAAARRPIFIGDQLAQTLAAAREPYKTLFAVGSVTGARLSECLGLVWADVQLDDLDAAAIRFEYQADRQGRRQPLKTDESRRTVEIPRQLAVMLVAHKLRSEEHERDRVRVRHALGNGDPAARRNDRPAMGAEMRHRRSRTADVSRPASAGRTRAPAARAAWRGAELPQLPPHRRERGNRRRRVRRGGLLAARTQD